MFNWPLLNTVQWPLKPLNELTVKIGSGATPRGGKETYTQSGVSFIRSQNVLDHRMSFDGLVHIDDTAAHSLRNVAVQEGDVLLNITGDSIARCCVVDKEVLPARVSQHVAIIRPIEGVNPTYLQKFLTQPQYRALMMSISSGGTRNALTKRQIGNFPIAVPSKATQTAIARILGTLDDKIVVNDRIAATARQLGRALFADITQTESLTVTLSELTEVLTRGITPKYSHASDAVCVVNQKCVRDGRVDLAQARSTLREKIKEPKHLRRFDVLVNSTGVGTLGRVAIWDQPGEATTDSHVTIVRFDASKIDPLCAGFAMLNMESDIELLAEGSTGQTELSRKRLGELTITVPPAEKMRGLRMELEALETRANAALSESGVLAELRDTLLPKLMSGEIRIRDAEKVVEEAT